METDEVLNGFVNKKCMVDIMCFYDKNWNYKYYCTVYYKNIGNYSSF